MNANLSTWTAPAAVQRPGRGYRIGAGVTTGVFAALMTCSGMVAAIFSHLATGGGSHVPQPLVALVLLLSSYLLRRRVEAESTDDHQHANDRPLGGRG
jgi:hypothetical protein